MSANVLLGEDNENNRYLETFLLEKHGHSVVHARDGASALAQVKRQRFDLILLDIQLPGLDGYRLARHLRGDAR